MKAPNTPEPLFERFAITSFYAGGAALLEVRVTHPLAVVEIVENSLVAVGSRS